ncbi:hypothetical protein HPB47_012167, partial [Ixodes persulcatus]
MSLLRSAHRPYSHLNDEDDLLRYPEPDSFGGPAVPASRLVEEGHRTRSSWTLRNASKMCAVAAITTLVTLAVLVTVAAALLASTASPANTSSDTTVDGGTTTSSSGADVIDSVVRVRLVGCEEVAGVLEDGAFVFKVGDSPAQIVTRFRSVETRKKVAKGSILNNGYGGRTGPASVALVVRHVGLLGGTTSAGHQVLAGSARGCGPNESVTAFVEDVLGLIEHPRQPRCYRRQEAKNPMSLIFSLLEPSSWNFDASLPGIRDIHDVVREETRKLLPAISCPAFILIAEIVSEQVRQAIHLETSSSEAASDEPRGLRYAEAPVGDRRWRRPVKASPESCAAGRQAASFGSPCLQLNPVTKKFEGSEDCLFVNVWTPRIDVTAGLEVMVWIHGGFLQLGSGHTPGLSPSGRLARKLNLVLVSFNYRLGPLGFLALGALGPETNHGLWDAAMALAWVRDNIRPLGGDPNKVTVFGADAGAAIALSLLAAAPRADWGPLFRSAWLVGPASVLNRTYAQ